MSLLASDGILGTDIPVRTGLRFSGLVARAFAALLPSGSPSEALPSQDPAVLLDAQRRREEARRRVDRLLLR